jgi:hypothetical protein
LKAWSRSSPQLPLNNFFSKTPGCLAKSKARPRRPGFFLGRSGGTRRLAQGAPIAGKVSQTSSATARSDVQILGKWHNPNVDVVDLVLSNPARLISLGRIAELGIGHAAVAFDQ